MADEIDKASDYYEMMHSSNLAAIRSQASNIPAGEPGECESCGLHSPRLVNGICAPCRDDLERLNAFNK